MVPCALKSTRLIGPFHNALPYLEIDDMVYVRFRVDTAKFSKVQIKAQILRAVNSLTVPPALSADQLR